MTRRLLLLQIICLALTSPARAEVPTGYDAATAHRPAFDQPEIWPKLSGKEHFLEQEWPEGRVMTWAKPGESIGGRGGLDPWNPENWLLNGETADEVFFDETTDIVLPDSEVPYNLDFKRVEGWPSIYRHVTVGRNAELGDEATRYFGNIWIKRSGGLIGRHANIYGGDRHTFLRNDNGSYDDPASGRIGQYFILNKTSSHASLEIIGNVSLLDRVPIDSGTLIIGPGSRFSPGRNASMIIGEGATVALLDGAKLVKWVNQIGQLDLIVFGTLQGGLPERPLQEPAFIGLGYQNTPGLSFYDRLPVPHRGAPLEKRVTSMIVAGTGTLRSFSANPDAKLHVRRGGLEAADWHLSPHGADREWVSALTSEQKTYLAERLEEIPKKITAIFQRGATVDQVVFNDFHAGGFLMEAPEELDQWSGLTFGEGNNATGLELVTRIARATVQDDVKNPGGSYQVGVPTPFARYEVTGEDWQTHTFTIELPAEAAGESIGIRFGREHNRNGWNLVDDVYLGDGGNNWLENPGFSEPSEVDASKHRGITLANVPAWENMGQDQGNVMIKQADGRRFLGTYQPGTSAGQTTARQAAAGSKLELRFDAAVKQPMLVEVYTLSFDLSQ